MKFQIKLCIVLLSILATNAKPAEETSDFQLSDFFEISPNDYRSNEISSIGRSTEANVEHYIKSHDVTFKLPFSTASLSFRNLDSDEVDVKLRFSDGNQVEARKKSKLKKIFIPIFVFILIKAMILIPLALGILAIKTWNAIQLSLVSFVVALSMGVWQLCKKVAGDHAHPQIIAHEPWAAAQYAAARSMNDAQNLAYSAHVQE